MAAETSIERGCEPSVGRRARRRSRPRRPQAGRHHGQVHARASSLRLVAVPALVRLAAAVHRSASASSTTPRRARSISRSRCSSAFLAFPAFKRSPRDRVPLADWVFALVGAFCAALPVPVLQRARHAPGSADDRSTSSSALTGVVLLLEATRRAMGFGMPMATLALFLALRRWPGRICPMCIAAQRRVAVALRLALCG